MSTLVELSRPAPGVAMITLNDPARRNAASTELVTELVRACDDIDADDSVGAVVITGSGEYFCSGADLGELTKLRAMTAGQAVEALNGVYRGFTRVKELTVPSIAAIRGGAVGAGLNLALSADVRIVAEDAVFRSGFARLGVHPGGGHFQLIASVAGPEVAAAMGIFDETLTGSAAVSAGLAYRALPADEVVGEAVRLAAKSTASVPLARTVARSYRAELADDTARISAALEIERWAQAVSFTTS